VRSGEEAHLAERTSGISPKSGDPMASIVTRRKEILYRRPLWIPQTGFPTFTRSEIRMRSCFATHRNCDHQLSRRSDGSEVP